MNKERRKLIRQAIELLRQAQSILETARDGVLEIRRSHDEAAKLREALRGIFDNADDFSGPDLRAAVADALGTTVKKLEKRK